MAELTFRLDEVVEFIKKNFELPSYFENIAATNEELRISVKKGKLPTLTIFLKFYKFENGTIFFQFGKSKSMGFTIPKNIEDSLFKTYQQQFEKLTWLEMDFPELRIFPGVLLNAYLKGIKIKDITYCDTLFRLTTI